MWSQWGKVIPRVNKPLRDLTRKSSRFHWRYEQNQSFTDIKNRLCRDDVLVPYDTNRKTRLYVDASPVGTQAVVAQEHTIDRAHTWRPVNYTSRAWTEAERG